MKIPQLAALSLFILFVAAMVSDQPAGNTDTPEKVTVQYWEKWTGFEGEAMRATIDKFNQKKIKNKKGQVIFCNHLTTTNVDRKSLLAISGGRPPDLAGFWSYNTHVFADLGALMPLDDFIKRDNFDINKYIDVYKDSCEHRGHIWCLVSVPASVALHWNKDLFRKAGLDPDRPPRTLVELKEYSDKLLKIDPVTGKVVQMGFLPVEPDWWPWAWVYFYGGKLNEGLDKITADTPQNIAAWEQVCSFGKGLKPEHLLTFSNSFGSFDSPQNAFLSGKVAMILQGVWMANFIRFNNPYLQWNCGPFPTADGNGEPFTIAESDVLVIPKGSPHPDEAWEVIKYINSDEGMEFLCNEQGKLTPFKKNRPGFIENHTHPKLQVFIDLAKSKNAFATPKLDVWEEYKAELTAAFQRVWLNNATAKDALHGVQMRMQPKLDYTLRVIREREQLEKENSKGHDGNASNK